MKCQTAVVVASLLVGLLAKPAYSPEELAKLDIDSLDGKKAKHILKEVQKSLKDAPPARHSRASGEKPTKKPRARAKRHVRASRLAGDALGNDYTSPAKETDNFDEVEGPLPSKATPEEAKPDEPLETLADDGYKPDGESESESEPESEPEEPAVRKEIAHLDDSDEQTDDSEDYGSDEGEKTKPPPIESSGNATEGGTEDYGSDEGEKPESPPIEASGSATETDDTTDYGSSDEQYEEPSPPPKNDNPKTVLSESDDSEDYASAESDTSEDGTPETPLETPSRGEDKGKPLETMSEGESSEGYVPASDDTEDYSTDDEATPPQSISNTAQEEHAPSYAVKKPPAPHKPAYPKPKYASKPESDGNLQTMQVPEKVKPHKPAYTKPKYKPAPVSDGNLQTKQEPEKVEPHQPAYTEPKYKATPVSGGGSQTQQPKPPVPKAPVYKDSYNAKPVSEGALPDKIPEPHASSYNADPVFD